MLVFRIDAEETALHVRNSIAEFVPKPREHYRKGDAIITVSGNDFATYFRGETNAAELLKKAKIQGNAGQLLSVFDRFVRIPMYPSGERP